MDKDGWRSMDSAPRDGSLIELTALDENGSPFEIWPMQWGHIMRNPLFAGDQVGMWMLPDGAMTWREGDGGPTHWRPVRIVNDQNSGEADGPAFPLPHKAPVHD